MAVFFLAAGYSCSMEKKDPDGNNDKYVNVYLTIGGTVYYDAEDGEPMKIEGLRVSIKGTNGVTSTNQHGFFIINTTTTINRSDVDESVVIQVDDIDGSAGGGLFNSRTVTINIGRLVEWNDASSVFVAKNDPSKLNIFVEKSL